MSLEKISEDDETPKTWEREISIVNNELYCGKKLILDEGFRSSLHYHGNKDKTFYVERGRVLLELGKEGEALAEKDMIEMMIEDGLDYNSHLETTVMEEGEALRIKPCTLHRYGSLQREAVIIEVSIPHKDEDSYRVEETGGRIPPEIMRKYNSEK